jgi:hypothetical protein
MVAAVAATTERHNSYNLAVKCKAIGLFEEGWAYIILEHQVSRTLNT